MRDTNTLKAVLLRWAAAGLLDIEPARLQSARFVVVAHRLVSDVSDPEMLHSKFSNPAQDIYVKFTATARNGQTVSVDGTMTQAQWLYTPARHVRMRVLAGRLIQAIKNVVAPEER